MKFKTTLHIAPQEIRIAHHDDVLLVGSCFSDYIGNYLERYKFICLSNPFGTVFHPSPIAWLIRNSINNNFPEMTDLLYADSLYFHDQFHYQFSNKDRTESMDRIIEAMQSFHARLRNAKYLVLTFGSAIGYSHKEKKRIVANCHKLDPGNFNKQMSSAEDLEQEWATLIGLLQVFNPGLQIIFTISPVRHIRDGIVESSRSKALLNVFIHALKDRFSNVHYFPSFEIMIDDLRDYRFYNDDLIHPNNMAVEYIWENFANAYFSASTMQLTNKIGQIIKARNHSIQHPDSAASRKFIEHQIQQITAFCIQYPDIDMQEELNYFRGL